MSVVIQQKQQQQQQQQQHLLKMISLVRQCVLPTRQHVESCAQMVRAALTRHVWHTENTGHTVHTVHTLYKQTRLAGCVFKEYRVAQIDLGNVDTNEMVIATWMSHDDQVATALQTRDFLHAYMRNNQLVDMHFVLFASDLETYLGVQTKSYHPNGSKLVSMRHPDLC